MSFIETPRLLIRKWQLPRDVEDAFAVYGDPETMHFIPGGAIDREKTQLYLERYATEAARAVMDFAFAELQIARLYALIDRFNAPSIALANRLGMQYDRIIRAYKRDLMRYEQVRR